MHEEGQKDAGGVIAEQQQLRERRMLWGFASQIPAFLIVPTLYFIGLLPLFPVLVYVVAIVLVNLTLAGLLRTGVNLRFRDPSMTVAQIVAPLWPAIYVMYFVSDPQARTVFLMLAIGGLLFGSFALSRRGMQALGGLIVLAYLVLLVALQIGAPERVNWPVEVIIVFAYAAVLVTVAGLGSYIATLRHGLKEKNRELEKLAGEDQLTRLPNRRSLMSQLARESARLDRHSPNRDSLCISMLDVDHFKRINDRWGHDAGDAVLRRIGEVLSAAMRQGDFVGRFGGEEFVLLLPDTSLAEAELVAGRVQELVAAMPCPELPEGEHVSVSQGLAEHRAGANIEVTLKLADQALYRAKDGGRSQVVVADIEADEIEFGFKAKEELAV